MKRIFFFMCLMLTVWTAKANDGVFFVNGNHLVPIHEEQIDLSKEVLTICIGDDGFARVDVQYELTNRGDAKTVIMGFQALAPYNDEVPLNKQGIHPYIYDFTVVMNNAPLPFSNAVVGSVYGEHTDFMPLDLERWKAENEAELPEGGWLATDALYNAQMDSVVRFSYAYYFKADFKPGKNTVHHTYRYRMSYGVQRAFEVPYWLTPAMRWGNKQIDDFTLRIEVPNTAKHFIIPDLLFSASTFNVTKGNGKVRKTTLWDTPYVEIALRDGAVEWHSDNFKPEKDITITSADMLLASNTQTFLVGMFYDRSDNYIPSNFLQVSQSPKDVKRILLNLPYASRGYVFKDRKLRTYFSQMWWYMPDPAYKESTADFTAREWRLINDGE